MGRTRGGQEVDQGKGGWFLVALVCTGCYPCPFLYYPQTYASHVVGIDSRRLIGEAEAYLKVREP